MVKEDNSAYKDDTMKPRMDLLPPDALVEIAKVFTNGAAKYADRNWERGMDWGRLYAATQRHLSAFWSGEDIDPEWGFSHLAHAGASILMLLSTYMRNIGVDSRQHLLQPSDSKDFDDQPIDTTNDDDVISKQLDQMERLLETIKVHANKDGTINSKEEDSAKNSISTELKEDSSFSFKYGAKSNVDVVGGASQNDSKPTIKSSQSKSSSKLDSYLEYLRNNCVITPEPCINKYDSFRYKYRVTMAINGVSIIISSRDVMNREQILKETLKYLLRGNSARSRIFPAI